MPDNKNKTPEDETEIEETEKPSILTGFSRVLEIIANKISRKAALLALAMLLTYLLVITPPLSTLITVNILLIIIGVVTGTAVFGVVLQFIIDKINADARRKRRREKEKEK